MPASPRSVFDRTMLNCTLGTLAFLDVGGDTVDMKLPTESPQVFGANVLLQDLRDVPDNKVTPGTIGGGNVFGGLHMSHPRSPDDRRFTGILCKQ